MDRYTILRKESEKDKMTKKEKEQFEIDKAFYYKRLKQRNNFKKAILFPFKLPFQIYDLITQKEKKLAQAKEIERLKRVMESKERYKNMRPYRGGIIEWEDKYLRSPGVFNIGVDTETSSEYIIDFNKNANVLIGGAPGSGKTKLVQMFAYQAIAQGSKIHIGDFKGGTDFQKFNKKCNVVTKHKDLIELLKLLMAEHKRRIKKFLEVDAENLAEYNEITGEHMLREYLVIDELGEAMEIIDVDIPEAERKKMEKTIEDYVKSLARLGRATGVNLIFGTQRPDVGVLKGQTRDQFLKRVCFQAVRNTSNIVLESPIATEISEDDKGQCFVNRNITFDRVQVYLFKKIMIKNLKDKNLVDFASKKKKKLKKLDDL